MRRGHGLLLLTLGSWTALCAPALAQTDTDAARAQFDRGVQRYQAGDFESALEAFQEAYRLQPHPAVRVNMANCYQQLGRPEEAVFHFERFLDEVGDAVSIEQRRQVEEALAALRRDQAPAQEPANSSFEAVPAPEAVAESVPPREMDPEMAEEMTEPASDLSGVDASRNSSDAPRESGFTRPVWISGGVTAGFLLAAVITGGLAIAANRDFDDAVVRSNDSTLSAVERNAAHAAGLDAADRADRRARAADVLLIGALVGAGTTVATYFLTRRTEESALENPRNPDQVRASPTVSREGVGLVVQGAF